jgi:hypothetical protein
MKLSLPSKIIIALFLAVTISVAIASVYTYVSINSGNFIEGDKGSAEIFLKNGLTNGLWLTSCQTVAIAFTATTGFFMLSSIFKVIVPDQASQADMIVFCFATGFLGLMLLVHGSDALHDVLLYHTGGLVNTIVVGA